MAEGDRSLLMRSWTLPDAEARTLGTVDFAGFTTDISSDPTGPSFAYASGRSVYLRQLGGAQATPARVVGHHSDTVSIVDFFPGGDGVASADRAGEIRLWPLGPSPTTPPRVLRGPRSEDILLAVDHDATRLARAGIGGSVHLWDLHDPPDAEQVVLKRPEMGYGTKGRFDPTGRWLVATNHFDAAFWPVGGRWKRELPGYSGSTWRLAFTPDGRWLVSCTTSEAAGLWPMGPGVGPAHTLGPEACWWVAPDPASTRVLVTTHPKGDAKGGAFLLPIAGGPPTQLRMGWEGKSASCNAAFDPQGRRAVTCPCFGGDPRLRVLRVWDLETGEGRTFSLAASANAPRSCESLAFTLGGAILVGGDGGMLRVVLPSDPKGSIATETMYAAGRVGFTLSPDGRMALVWVGRSPGARTFDDLLLLDLTTHTSRRITTHGQRLWTATLDPSGRVIVSADVDGVVRAGPITGEEPHLLLGHTTSVLAVAVSPDGQWIASVSDDGINLWPMPDVTKAPLHTLPHAELMAKLDALTNLRVVRDPTSSTGWSLDVGSFPGWEEVPTW
jgi:WD40 repeat protein